MSIINVEQLRKIAPNGHPNIIAAIASQADCLILSTDDPKNTNTIDEPTKIVPVPSKIDDAGTDFSHAFPGNSISVMTLSAG